MRCYYEENYRKYDSNRIIPVPPLGLRELDQCPGT